MPDFGSILVCSVRPDTTDISKFEYLESILNDDCPIHEKFWEQIGYEGDYEYKPCMDSNFNLNLKLRENESGWKFETTLGKTEDDIKDKLFKGVKVDVVVTPGFYFNDEKKTFGMYYTVKNIDAVVEKKKK